MIGTYSIVIQPVHTYYIETKFAYSIRERELFFLSTLRSSEVSLHRVDMLMISFNSVVLVYYFEHSTKYFTDKVVVLND